MDAHALEMPIKRLDESLDLPAYAKPGDAGLDLMSSINAVIAPGRRLVVPCGIAIAIPQGYAGLVIPRSGLAAKKGITIVNAPGLIDSGYRGEVKVILLNTDDSPFNVHEGDRIAQLVIIQVPEVQLVEVKELETTQRGHEGFGSSGV